MAHKRAQLAGYALEDLHTHIDPIRDRKSPVEPPSDPDLVPAPSSTPRNFVSVPLGYEGSAGASILEGFASLRPSGQRERMVPYPIRLPASQIATLERLKESRGVVPAQFIRDAVASCLSLLGEV